MSKSRMEKFLSFAKSMYYDKIGKKFKPSLMKNFWDKIFIIFEKVIFNFPFFSSNYLKLYEEIVQGEIILSNASADDKILVVGCGSLPATTALISMKTNANIVAIDCDSKAIFAARQYIKNLDIKNIKVENIDGKDYSVNDFDVIFLLFGLTHQKEILTKYAQEMKKNARIIYRMPSDIKDMADKKLNEYFKVAGCRRSKTMPAVDSYLLIKKN
jgi:2-polyprenyl-3-methyl-5-hydroxy-6-metoxy-1,4-benzoquinol methylase